jgi:hypothetical protein
MVDITRVLQNEYTRDTMFNHTLFDVCKGKMMSHLFTVV